LLALLDELAAHQARTRTPDAHARAAS